MRPDYVHFDDIYWIRVVTFIFNLLEREGALLMAPAQLVREVREMHKVRKVGSVHGARAPVVKG